jgi:hypothetical protein
LAHAARSNWPNRCLRHFCAILSHLPGNKPDLVSSQISRDEMLCAMWVDKPILCGPLTIETLLSQLHLLLAADGVSEGLLDKALAERGLARIIVATMPYYLLSPWVLRHTNMITAFGDSMLLAFPELTGIALVWPPLPVGDVVFHLYVDRRMERYPGGIWLRNLLIRIAGEENARKRELRTLRARGMRRESTGPLEMLD